VSRGRLDACILVALVVLSACDRPPESSQAGASELARGQGLYEVTCAACHQPDGNGKAGVASPLRDSEWVLGPEGRLVRIALNGIHGPVVVRGKEYNLEMPAFGLVFSDEELAATLTYVRQAWGHKAPTVTAATVARWREASRSRGDSWTAAELLGEE